MKNQRLSLNWCRAVRLGPLVAIALVLAIFTTGCGSMNKSAAKRIRAFSTATELTAKNTVDAFDTVEKRHFDLTVARLAVGDEWKSFDPQALAPFLPPEQLQVRKEVLAGLQGYAETLSALMGNQQLDALDEATADLAESLKSANGEFVKANFTAASDKEIEIGVTALNALGRWLIDWKRHKAVASAAVEMHPHVTNIVRLLQSDFKVLRRNIGKEYDEEIQAKRRFIDANEARLDPIAKRVEIRAIVETVLEMKQADTALAAMQKSLTKLQEAHAELPNAFKSKGGIRLDELIADSIEEGKRIKKFYDSLEN